MSAVLEFVSYGLLKWVQVIVKMISDQTMSIRIL